MWYSVAMNRRPPSSPDARSAAEKAFKTVTTKKADLPPRAPSVPGVKEQVTLRLDREVLDFFQADGPGWQDRINAALRKAAGK